MNIINKINMWSENLLKYFFYLMFISVIMNVFLRYIFNINFIFMQELVMYMHAFIFLFGVSICLKDDSHVRIDIFANKISKKVKEYIEVLGYILFVIPFCIFVIYESTPMIFRSWEMWETSSEPGGLPFVYILKSSIYVFSILIIFQVFIKLFRLK